MSSAAWFRCAVVSAGLSGSIQFLGIAVSPAGADETDRFTFSVRCLMVSPNEG